MVVRLSNYSKGRFATYAVRQLDDRISGVDDLLITVISQSSHSSQQPPTARRGVKHVMMTAYIRIDQST
jgi:hypothetical protein